MHYASIADLYTKFGQTEIQRLADKNNNGNLTEINAVLVSAQEYADSKINAVIGDRINSMLQDATQLAALKFPALALMRWDLHGTRVTDEVQARYEDALATLKAIRQGTEGVGIANGDNAVASLDSAILITAPNVSTRWGGGVF